MLIKQSPWLPRNLALVTFGNFLIVFSTRVNLLYLLYSTVRRASASDKAKLFAKNFSKNPNLDDRGTSLPVFTSRTNLKLHNISVTPEMVKKFIMNLDLSKASGPDCIAVVVPKKCEPELYYILVSSSISVLRGLFSRLLEGFISGFCI